MASNNLKFFVIIFMMHEINVGWEARAKGKGVSRLLCKCCTSHQNNSAVNQLVYKIIKCGRVAWLTNRMINLFASSPIYKHGTVLSSAEDR